jgi:hypothetical protein
VNRHISEEKKKVLSCKNPPRLRAAHNEHRSAAVDSTLRTVAHSAAAGRTARRTGMAFARVQRIKELIRVHGIMALKFRAYTHGQGRYLSLALAFDRSLNFCVLFAMMNVYSSTYFSVAPASRASGRMVNAMDLA